MTVENFEDLNVWKQARQLTQETYRLTRTERFKRFWSAGSNAAGSGSIMSNIAEGFERGGNQEFLQFLYIAKASCGEVRSQLYVALDQGYVTENETDKLLQSFKRLSGMIRNLVTYIRQSEMKGEKFMRSQRTFYFSSGCFSCVELLNY